ncbi:hypothetical protein [Caulobacter sp. Root1472]|uniref:hypothetical protein n=1 Tax=Caulobacter sp. Root1472 TaxID=1736470 RepID=UPI0006FCA639|nr:hypothetical protein [Caulobacter sp. Root1472]KQZ33560.1 hypothetical protein ASD47_00265 [Caulobacter sp. Root1472]
MTFLLRRAAMAVIAIACLSLGACDKNLVKVSYQQLGNAQSWNLENKSGGDANGMWRIYMLRGVVNDGENAKPFTFDLSKVALKNGAVVTSAGPMLHGAPFMLPVNFKAPVAPKVAYTVPYGSGVMFVIKEDGDTDKAAYTTLTYKSASGESVLMVPLDSKATPAFGQIDQAFLNVLHSKQNTYENTYQPSGDKN